MCLESVKENVISTYVQAKLVNSICVLESDTKCLILEEFQSMNYITAAKLLHDSQDLQGMTINIFFPSTK